MRGDWLPLILFAVVFVLFLLRGGSGGGWGPRCWSPAVCRR